MTQQIKKQTEKKWSTLDKVVGLSSACLAIDGIIIPFLTGRTLRDSLGLPPAGDYELLGDRTVKMAESALWGLTNLYLVGKGLLYNSKNNKHEDAK